MAPDKTQQVVSKGIYHGLPTFGPEHKNLTAIITGANGISGYYMMRVLAQSPERWAKIYCLSRRPPAIPGGLPAHAEHIPCDFLKGPEEIAAVLQDHGVAKADYVFFFAYIQAEPREGGGLWSDQEEMVRVNMLLLNNFLGALTQARITPKRFMLQTGAKNYGIHLGPSKVPQEESDPRVELEPNFYYPQEDALWTWCKSASPRVHWNIGMPSYILGAVPDAAMNAAYPLAIYAAVSKHLGEPLDFPSDMVSWQMTQTASSAMMNAYLEEWMVLTDGAEDQKFNAADNSAFAWEKAWPRVAGWYGIPWNGPDLASENYAEIQTAYDPPPRGYGGKGTIRFRYTTTQWAKRPEVAKAYKELAEKHDLVDKELRDVDRVFAFLDGWIGMSHPMNFSMDKSRKLGWHGFVDSSESLLEVFESFAELKMIPPVPKVDVKFN